MHEHRVHIYYEDTDHSGLVYHANYLKYFERAREHMLGTGELRRLFLEEGIGFVVYEAQIAYRRGAVFGDTLVVRSTVEAPTPYRSVFAQNVYREADGALLVKGVLTLVCIDRDKQLVELPPSVLAVIRAA